MNRGQLFEESALIWKARFEPNISLLINIDLHRCFGLPDWPITTTLVDSEESKASLAEPLEATSRRATDTPAFDSVGPLTISNLVILY